MGINRLRRPHPGPVPEPLTRWVIGGMEIETMMSPELQARWSAALREPDRLQGTGQLCRVEPDGSKRQCCLDVLVDLYREDHPEDSAITVEQSGSVVTYTWTEADREDGEAPYKCSESSYLPRPVADWAGVNYSPSIGGVYAVSLNDGRGYAFGEIADRLDEPGVTVY